MNPVNPKLILGGEMKRFFITEAVFLMLLCFTGLTYASLVTTGTVLYDGEQRNLIYDTDFNITWLDYSREEDSWYNQMNWADNLSLTVNGMTYDNWYLPETVDGDWEYGEDGTTTAGFNITTSDMGHLYYTELGNIAYPGSPPDPDPTATLQRSGPFENLLSDAYWSMTTAAANSLSAWVFMFASGYQTRDPKDGLPTDMYPGGGHSAIAIMSGRIQVGSNVPVPTTAFLFGIGLLGFAGVARRKT